MTIFDDYMNKTIYTEGLFLLSDYTIGFELECVIPKENFVKFKQFALNYFPPSHGISIPKNFEHFTEDGSIEYDTTKEDGCEYRSPVFKLTPQNIEKIINFLTIGSREYFYTNSSCGFHIHIGIPSNFQEKDKNSFWILLNLALDKNMQNIFKQITEYNGIKLYSAPYSILNVIENINRELVEDEGYNRKLSPEQMDKKLKKLINEFFNDEKYTILRIHPQGTLEWRGPRGFLDEGGHRKIISGFFIEKLYPFIRWINDVMEKEEIKLSNGEIYTRIKVNNKIQQLNKYVNVEYKHKFVNMSGDQIAKVMYFAPWLRKADFKNAIFTINKNMLVMKEGRWFDGNWVDGEISREVSFENGIFENGNLLTNPDNVTILGGNIYCTFLNQGKIKGGVFHRTISLYDVPCENATFKSQASFMAYPNTISNCVFDINIKINPNKNMKFINCDFKSGLNYTYGNDKVVFENCILNKNICMPLGIFINCKTSSTTVFDGGIWEKGLFTGIWKSGVFLDNIKNLKNINNTKIITDLQNYLSSQRNGE